MMVIGIDAHKRSHTAVTVDEMGRQGFVKTVGTTTQDNLRLLKWALGLAGCRWSMTAVLKRNPQLRSSAATAALNCRGG
jgi:hypothetical protein